MQVVQKDVLLVTSLKVDIILKRFVFLNYHQEVFLSLLKDCTWLENNESRPDFTAENSQRNAKILRAKNAYATQGKCAFARKKINSKNKKKFILLTMSANK